MNEYDSNRRRTLRGRIISRVEGLFTAIYNDETQTTRVRQLRDKNVCPVNGRRVARIQIGIFRADRKRLAGSSASIRFFNRVTVQRNTAVSFRGTDTAAQRCQTAIFWAKRDKV